MTRFFAKTLTITTFACLSVITSTIVAAPLPPAVEAAVRVHHDTHEKARKRLADSFDFAIRQAQDGGGKAEIRAKQIELLTTEKDRFEKFGSLPWSAVARPAAEDYLRTVSAADARLSKAYDEFIDLNLRLNKPDIVKGLRDGLKSDLNVKPIASWQHAVNDGRSGEMVLYSNGKIGSEGSKNTWRYAGGRLTLRWVNERAPGGAWVDNCRVSADGMTYSGGNQQGARISGRLNLTK